MTVVSFFAAAASQTLDPSAVWTSFVIPLLTSLIGGSIAGTFINHRYASAEKRREQYAEAVACLVAWCEYPFMIRRRVNDQPATLERLVQHGHGLHERIAMAEAWVAAENPKMGQTYSSLVGLVKGKMGPLLNEAWNSSPASSPSVMVLDGWGRDAHQGACQAISAFRRRTHQRFGWRRLIRAETGL